MVREVTLRKNLTIGNTMRHPLCGCTTGAGKQCNRAKAAGSDYCWQHVDCKIPFTGNISPKKAIPKKKASIPKITSGRGKLSSKSKSPKRKSPSPKPKRSPTPTIKLEKIATPVGKSPSPRERLPLQTIKLERAPTPEGLPRSRTPTPKKSPTPPKKVSTPQKKKSPTPQKKAATPQKKAATPQKKAATPQKKATPKKVSPKNVKNAVRNLKKAIKDEGINVDRLRITVNRIDPNADVTAQAIAEFTNEGDYTEAFKLIDAKSWLDPEILEALPKYLTFGAIPIIEEILNNTKTIYRKRFPEVARQFRQKGMKDVADAIESYVGSEEGPQPKEKSDEVFDFTVVNSF